MSWVLKKIPCGAIVYRSLTHPSPAPLIVYLKFENGSCGLTSALPLPFLSSNLSLIVFYLPYAAPTKITYNAMPRTPNFNSAREDCARKTAKSKVRGGGGKFAKRDSMDCTNVIANPITNAGVRKCSEPDLGVHFADPMEDEC